MDYDSWKTGYYESEQEHHCSDCRELEQKFDETSEFLQPILDMIYGVKPLDKEKMDFLLEQVAWRVGADFPYKEAVKIYSINNNQNKIFNFTLNLAKTLTEKAAI